MDYVAFLSFRPAADRDAALMRRTQWQYPEAIKPIAEYWPQSSTTVVTIFSTDDAASIMQLTLEWEDLFDISIHPALSAEEGLRVGPEVYGRLLRTQQH